jgi:PAS domain S-box-containing protein
MVSVVEGNGVISYVSSAAKAVLGYEPSALIGRRACDLLHVDEALALAQMHGRVQVRRDGDAQVHRLRRSDGSYAWVESNAREFPPAPPEPHAVLPLSPSPSESRAVLFVSRDITDRLAVEQRVLELNNAWTEVFDGMREGVVVIDRDGLVVAANRAAGGFLHADTHHLLGSLGRTQVVVIDENGHPMATEELPSTRAMRTGTTHEQSLAYRRRDGSVVWLHARAIPVQRLGEQQPSRVAILLEDAVGPPIERTEAVPSQSAWASAAREVLTPREVQVLKLLAEGLDVRAVAAALGISLHTARGHVKSLMRKLDARTQLQAVVLALRAGLLEVR